MRPTPSGLGVDSDYGTKARPPDSPGGRRLPHAAPVAMHNATDLAAREPCGAGQPGVSGLRAALASLAIAVGGVAAPVPVLASADLAAKKMCMGCHRIDERRNGPSFRDIARRYAGQPDAVATLSRKVITGGHGAWGRVPMPANPQLSEAEARQIVQWILTHR